MWRIEVEGRHHQGAQRDTAEVSRAFMRNALDYAGKSQRRIFSAWIGNAFAQDDAEAARKEPRPPRLATLMNDAEVDVLAYMSSPAQHRAKLHSTNPLERLNGEIKRRADVVGIDLSAPCYSSSMMNGPFSVPAT